MNEETAVLQQWLTSNLIETQEEDRRILKCPLINITSINEMILDRTSTYEKDNSTLNEYNSFQKLSVDLPIQDAISYSNPFNNIFNSKISLYTVHNKSTDSSIISYPINKRQKPLYKCHFADCLMDFRHKWLLERHLESHSTYSFFKCKENNCHKTYKSKENLVLHVINVHKQEKPFKCKHCNMKFSHRNGIIK